MRTPRIVSTLLLVNLSVLLSATAQETSRPQEYASKSVLRRTYDDPEGYQILSLVLEDQATSLKLERLNIYDRNVETTQLQLCNAIPQEFQSAADDLKNKSKTEFKFKRKFTLNRPYDLQMVYTPLMFGISVAGFDPSRTHAIVSVTWGCGEMCSAGYVYLFRKTEKGWQKVGQICETMS